MTDVMTVERLAVAGALADVVLNPCYYCGAPADTIDHVVPQVILRTATLANDRAVVRYYRRKHRVLTVGACGECNSLLGSAYYGTLAERKAALKDSLRRRYRRVLATPDWTDAELAQLSERLRSRVILTQALRQLIQARLAW